MTRVELALALGVALAVAVGLGWGLHMLWRHLGGARDAEMAALIVRLAEAEAAAAAAEARAVEVEARLTAQLTETETTLRRDLAQRQAELKATMETVGDLRRRLAEAEAAAPPRRAG